MGAVAIKIGQKAKPVRTVSETRSAIRIPITEPIRGELVPREIREKARELILRSRGSENVDEARREFRQLLDAVPGENSSQKINRILYAEWVDPIGGEKEYDDHMIDHERAIMVLMRKISDMQVLGYDIFGEHVMEASSGTGTLIRQMCDILPPGVIERMKVIANDISPEMQIKSIPKLGEARVKPSEIGWMNQDLRELDLPDSSFDTIMLGQTLHLVTDTELRDLEVQLGFSNGEEDQQVKLNVLESFFRALKSDRYFLMFDEWAPRFTDDEVIKSSGKDDGVISHYFHATFRPLVKRTTFRQLMGMVPKARFVAEFKARIDRFHNMYVFVYKKDDDKILVDRRMPSQYPVLRRAAVGRILDVLKATDQRFIESFSKRDGENNHVVHFPPFSSSHPLFMDRSSLLSETGDLIIIEQLHGLNEMDRIRKIHMAVERLNLGGALLFLETWPCPSTKYPQIRKSHLRGMMARAFQRSMMFEAAVREPLAQGYYPGIYGFLYRKFAE